MMRHIHPRKQTDFIGKNLIKAKTITAGNYFFALLGLLFGGIL